MAQEGYASNTYGNKLLGDISELTFKYTRVAQNASQLDPNSGPGVVCTSADGATAVTFTIPKSVVGFVSGVFVVNAAQTLSLITLDAQAGTFGFTLSAGLTAGANNAVHVTLYLCAP